MNVPIDTLAFAERFEGAGFGHDQARALAAAFGLAQEAGREDLATKTDLTLVKAEVLQAIAENGKDVGNRLWSTVTIIAGVSTAISATIGAAVALVLKWEGL